MDNQTLLIIGKKLRELEKLVESLSLNNINNDKNKLGGKNKILFDYFESNKGKIVIKDDIAEIIWNDPDVTDWAINQVISRFRKKLVKLGYDPGNLRTVNGKGYVWK